jgi:8-oxo-dGTP diphosphatase
MDEPKINFYGLGEKSNHFNYVFIVSLYNGRWIWVRLRNRNTWELPAGHVETNESSEEAAQRELMEETGAVDFTIKTLCDCTIEFNDQKSHSRIFYANVTKLGDLPASEVEEIKLFDSIPEKLTYYNIQPIIFRKAQEMIKSIKP